MWRRRRVVSRLQRALCILLLYLILLIVMFTLSPELPSTFLADHHRVDYPLMFLSTSAAGAPFTDVAGAEVFASRRCGGCFLTNNKGFMPLADYDAVLVHGTLDLLSEMTAFMDPGKRYLIETSQECISNKFQCSEEPKLTSFSTREQHTLCSLCDQLIRSHQKTVYSRITYIDET